MKIAIDSIKIEISRFDMAWIAFFIKVIFT